LNHISISQLLPRARDLPAPVRGALWYSTAGALWAGTGIGVRYLSAELHPLEIAFFRALFGFLWLLFWIVPWRVALLPRHRFGLYTARGVCEVFAMLAWFSAVALIPVADVVALSFTAPLFATVLAVAVLSERVGVRRWSAVAVGMVGALIILRPGGQELSTGAMLALASAVAIAGSRISARRLAQTEPVSTIVASIALFTVPCTLVPMLLVWQTPNLDHILLMLALSAVSTVGHVCLTLAFRVSEASELAPYDFSQLVMAVIFGVIAFGEVPDVWTWVGGVIVVGTAIYVVRREARLARLRAAEAVAGAARTDRPGTA
jgi:drug/metabolite transporter (DMT)-like permease